MISSAVNSLSGTRAFAIALSTTVGVALVCMGFLYSAGLGDMLQAWSRDEYSHGYIIPFIAVYLFARALPNATKVVSRHKWFGPVVACLAVALGLVGNFGHLPDIIQYGLILALVAALLAVMGLRSTLLLWVPIVYLLFMVPLPQFLYLKISLGMQLVSSQLGVSFIRLADIPVYLEGNIIDLGVYKLQVAEACSGLRYLFPLMSFGFLLAVLYRGPRWHKLALFLSTIPIAVVMNSFRIGVIGVLVDGYGVEQAEGFLHFFEGWVIFLACIGILLLEAFTLLRLSSSRETLREALDLQFHGIAARLAGISFPRDLRALVATTAILFLGALGLQLTSERPSAVPPRQQFAMFPSHLSGWRGQQSRLGPIVTEVLGADDYLRSYYAKANGTAPISVFIAYYESQTDGRAAHSPEVCIPGGGWEIRSLETADIEIPGGLGSAIKVNRAIIQNGTIRQLVYYWFEQRGRRLTSEYMVKWHILWDGVLRNRTDGSLVRLITPILDEGAERAADKRLTELLGPIYHVLPRFLPQ